MKTVKILVEGTRDAALLASVFQICELSLSDVRAKKKDKASRTLRAWYDYEFKTEGLVGEYEGKKNSELYRLEVYISGGYTQFENLLNVFEDKDGNGVIPAVVYDADSSLDTKNSGGNTARRHLLKKQYDSYSFQRKPTEDLSIFLFPNNKDDGTVETLLERISAKKKRKAITICWMGYEYLLRLFHFFKPTEKSKINEYASATIGPDVWDYQGQNKALFNRTIWNWHSQEIQPLFGFIENLISKV